MIHVLPRAVTVLQDISLAMQVVGEHVYFQFHLMFSKWPNQLILLKTCKRVPTALPPQLTTFNLCHSEGYKVKSYLIVLIYQ